LEQQGEDGRGVVVDEVNLNAVGVVLLAGLILDDGAEGGDEDTRGDVGDLPSRRFQGSEVFIYLLEALHLLLPTRLAAQGIAADRLHVVVQAADGSLRLVDAVYLLLPCWADR